MQQQQTYGLTWPNKQEQYGLTMTKQQEKYGLYNHDYLTNSANGSPLAHTYTICDSHAAHCSYTFAYATNLIDFGNICKQSRDGQGWSKKRQAVDKQRLTSKEVVCLLNVASISFENVLDCICWLVIILAAVLMHLVCAEDWLLEEGCTPTIMAGISTNL